MIEYPTKIYGTFCSENSEVIIQQWIPFLEQALRQVIINI